MLLIETNRFHIIDDTLPFSAILSFNRESVGQPKLISALVSLGVIMLYENAVLDVPKSMAITWTRRKFKRIRTWDKNRPQKERYQLWSITNFLQTCHRPSQVKPQQFSMVWNPYFTHNQFAKDQFPDFSLNSGVQYQARTAKQIRLLQGMESFCIALKSTPKNVWGCRYNESGNGL